MARLAKAAVGSFRTRLHDVTQLWRPYVGMEGGRVCFAERWICSSRARAPGCSGRSVCAPSGLSSRQSRHSFSPGFGWTAARLSSSGRLASTSASSDSLWAGIRRAPAATWRYNAWFVDPDYSHLWRAGDSAKSRGKVRTMTRWSYAKDLQYWGVACGVIDLIAPLGV